MPALVVYDSVFGHTEQIARAVAAELGEDVEVRAAQTLGTLKGPKWDLLVVGGPTHRHGLSDIMAHALDRLGREMPPGICAAAFDTRYRVMKLLSGSAAEGAVHRMRDAGLAVVVAPASFFMLMERPPRGEEHHFEHEELAVGEVERAAAWARTVRAAAAAANAPD